MGDQVEALLDGGIRRGSDVREGARTGRQGRHPRPRLPVGHGRGRRVGVTNVLEILRSGVNETLLGLGKSSVRELSPADVIVPAGFTLDQKR